MINKIINSLSSKGPIFVLNSILGILKTPIILPFMILKLKFGKIKEEEYLNFVFEKNSALIKPFQIKYEISELLNLLKELNPRAIIEIGTANGGTLFLFCRIATSNAKIISIDLPRGSFGGGYPKWKIPLYNSFTTKNQDLHLIRSNSHSKKTFDLTKEILGNQKADFIFIDGDHTYNGVKKDFESYRKLVDHGGIIAFHDIVPGPENAVGGVARFWQEIKQSYEHVEIVENWNQKESGIGIIKIKH